MRWTRVATNSRAVDGDIDPAVPLYCLVNRCRDGGLASDVGLLYGDVGGGMLREKIISNTFECGDVDVEEGEIVDAVLDENSGCAAADP